MSNREIDSDTDSEESYQSDDSDINFIPGYIIECSEPGNSEDDCSDQDDIKAGLAYIDEPLVDKDWLENYKRQEETRLELQKKLERRLDGSVEVSEWCRCGKCDVTLLVNNSECYCCCELEGCQESMRSEEVISDLQAEGIQNAKCVTQHPGFNSVCLQKWSLKMAAYKFKTKNNSKYTQMSTQNSFLRSISYRAFTRLVYGLLGNRRIPLPACAYMAIRKTFPVIDKEHFTGYSDESD